MTNASIQDGILMVEPGALVGTPGLRLTMNTDGSKRTVIYGAHKLAMNVLM